MAELLVKLSILCSFRVLVRRLPRLKVYLWITVGFNILTGLFLALLDFGTCPSAERARLGEYFRAFCGWSSELRICDIGKCDPPNSVKIRMVSYVGSTLDVVSDLTSNNLCFLRLPKLILRLA